jgi:hypothetical protein
VSTAVTARKIYRATKDSPAAVAQIRAEFSALALSLATNPDAAFELTSSTVNGQTFSGKRTMTNQERLDLLSQVVWSYDNCQQLPRTTRTLF